MSLAGLKYKLGTKRLKNIIHASAKDGYVYISNPKAACSSIKLYLARCWQNNPEFTPVSLHKRKHLPFDDPGKLTNENLERLFNGNYFVFTFVRHPLKRAVSAYGDKIKGNTFQKKEILALLGSNPEELQQPVSFDEFVEAITSQKPEKLNPHWRPQVYNLYPNTIKYDFIGHLETFDTDFNYVRKTLKLPSFPVKRQNVKSFKADPEKLLSPFNRFRLARLYARDFVKFGYRPRGIEYLGVAAGYFPGLRGLNVRQVLRKIRLNAKRASK